TRGVLCAPVLRVVSSPVVARLRYCRCRRLEHPASTRRSPSASARQPPGLGWGSLNAHTEAGMQDVGSPASADAATSRERRRQRAVDSLALSRDPNPRLDRITRLGAAVFDVPITSITVVDHGQAWFP